ncbi:MAG: hypothetical protein AMJ79_15010 [Phycisphaerae bacterium SM23_30]|nr:MAG: hypothetical protein AMJ79_15010 [Phycisphaerae bacterium SM23_30]
MPKANFCKSLVLKESVILPGKSQQFLHSQDGVGATAGAKKGIMRQGKYAKYSVRVKFVAYGAVLAAVTTALGSAGCAPPSKVCGYEIKYYYTQTEDNFTLGLRRYRPEFFSEDKDPVILCHGFSYNMLFWDLSEEASLPRYLAEGGYDVWLLSLRGAAPSSQPLNSAMRKLVHFHLDPEMLITITNRLRDLKMLDWSVDDHIFKDVPTAVRFVLQETGRERVHWVGHSMGGMIMFAYLGHNPSKKAEQLNSLVAIAAPMVIFHPLNDPFDFLLKQQGALSLGSHILGSSVPATLGAILGDLNTPMDKLFYNSQNVHGATLRLLFQRAEEEMGPSQFKQLLEMVRTERFRSLDKTIDYTEKLREVTTPTLLLAGTVDNMATPGAVRYAWRNLGSEDKDFRLFGRVNSQRNDYGHNDLVIGEHARKEVYPAILEWLKKHDAKK